MELAAGGVNKAQTHFTLYAVPHILMLLILFRIWQLQRVRTKQKTR